MECTMDDLERVYNAAKTQRLDVCLELTTGGVIINKYNKLDTTLEYFKKNYDYNLVNKSDKNIKVVNIKVWRR